MKKLCVYCEVGRNFSNGYKRNKGLRDLKKGSFDRSVPPGTSMLTIKWTHNADVCALSLSSQTAMFNILK